MARKISKRDLKGVAEQITDELRRRESGTERKHLEKVWKEVDRQVRMEAPVNTSQDPSDAWMPNIEMPFQFNALEIIDADARQLMFPEGQEWYQVHAELTDEYADRVERDPPFKDRKPEKFEVDQEFANLVVHAVLDWFHSQYPFREMWGKCRIEAIKYGNLIGRAVANTPDVISRSYRGSSGLKIPMFVAGTIRDTFLDDRIQAVMHEGLMVQPDCIQRVYQNLNDLKRAARAENRGWLPGQLEGLEAKTEGPKRGTVELIRFEGDLFVPRSRGEDIYLPSQKILVAVGNEARVVRLEDAEDFRSEIHGTYMLDGSSCPYGVGPLMKGQPLQEAATEAMNRMLQVMALQAEPPVEWDRNDMELLGRGGPKLIPGEQWDADNPGSTTPMKIGDLPAAQITTMALAELYEQLTGVNDPRRGGGPKSHTTTGGQQIAASRGVLRTEDFVLDLEEGPMTDWLYIEYAMAKKLLGKKTITVPLKMRGFEDYITVNGTHLPDRAEFFVNGASGILSKREQRDNWLAVSSVIGQFVPAALQGVIPPDLVREIIAETFAQFGIADSQRFTRALEGGPGGTASGPQIPEIGGLVEGANPIP